MKPTTQQFFDAFFSRHADLVPLRAGVLQTIELLAGVYRGGGKLLLCGNGGSAADCDHIAGELLKGFLLRRPVSAGFAGAMQAKFGPQGAAVAAKLQQGLPAISLVAHGAALSAFANDVDPTLVYAQQVLAYGKPGDVLLGISTSGNAENVAAAVMCAKAQGLTAIGLTGRSGGRLAELADFALVSPQTETYRIQEDHLALYHLICGAVEYELFDE